MSSLEPMGRGNVMWRRGVVYTRNLAFVFLGVEPVSRAEFSDNQRPAFHKYVKESEKGKVHSGALRG